LFACLGEAKTRVDGDAVAGDAGGFGLCHALGQFRAHLRHDVRVGGVLHHGLRRAAHVHQDHRAGMVCQQGRRCGVVPEG
jgi:hypothetical protein